MLIAFDPADMERLYVRPEADPQQLVAYWACCGGACSDSHTATCAVLAPFASAVEAMLIGIRREIDTWSGEHRCFHRLGERRTFHQSAPCSCGTDWLFDVVEIRYQLNWAWAHRFVIDIDELDDRTLTFYTARPGTTLERVP